MTEPSQTPATIATAIAARAGRPARGGELAALALAHEAGRPLRQRDFLAAGIHRQHLADMATLGFLERVARGCYRLPGDDVPGAGVWGHLAAVPLRWPQAVVCGPTAAALHGLIADDGSLWLAVERGHGRPKGRLAGHPLRIREWLPRRRALGVVTLTVGGVAIPVVDAAHAVAELAELSSRIGSWIGLAAERAYMERGGDAAVLEAAVRHVAGRDET